MVGYWGVGVSVMHVGCRAALLGGRLRQRSPGCSRVRTSRLWWRVTSLWRVLAATCTVLLACAAYAAGAARADSMVPCATDSSGNPMYFDTSVSSGDPHPYLCTITTHVNADASEDVRIDRPVVDHSS